MRIDEAHAALQGHLHSSDSAAEKLREAERQRRTLERRLAEVKTLGHAFPLHGLNS